MTRPMRSDHWLELLDEPAALIAHQAGTVVAANARFAALLRLVQVPVIGALLSSLVSADDAPRLREAMAVDDPAQITLRFPGDGGAPGVGLACHFGPMRSGQRLLRVSSALPVGNAEGSDSRVGEQQREVGELRQKLAWFREAIDKVHHSVVIFDQQDRLVLCNKFYRDGYRSGDRVLPPEITLEGKTYRELMELRVHYKLHKEFADDPARFIEDRVRRFEVGTDHITYLATGAVVRSQYSPPGGRHPRLHQYRHHGTGGERAKATGDGVGVSYEIAVPRQYEPRTAHAAQCDPRILGADPGCDDGAGRCPLSQLRRRHLRAPASIC